MYNYFSNDPISDFHRYEAERQREIEKLPVCCDCGDHIQDDLYDIDGDLYCEDCMRINFKKPLEDYIKEDY